MSAGDSGPPHYAKNRKIIKNSKYITPPFASGLFDLFRWVAAMVVLMCHTRSMFYGSFYDIPHPTILDRGLFAMTLFWHQAVMVFFVLSGYFIGSSVLKSVSEDRFSWKRYLINRWSRLYIVLIPALILTVVLDQIGMSLWGTNAYQGAENRSSVIIWLASLFMAQPVHFPQYGTNTPLWSLSYEFWYYLLFPAIVLATSKKNSGKYRLAMLLFIVGMLLFMQLRMALYFLVWLLGVLVAVMPVLKQWNTRKWAYPIIGLFSMGGMIGVRLLERLSFRGLGNHWPSQLCSDLILSVFFALFCYATKAYACLSPGKSFPLVKLHKGLADFSYTSYLTHHPIIVFISASGLIQGGELLGKGRWDILIFAGLILFVVGCAYLISLFTERKTSVIRKWITAKLN